MKIKRTLNDLEYEIVDQILVAEICLNICKATPIVSGRGSDFIPFYYNLNFSKGIITLHSLLISNQFDEITIRNYLKQYKAEYPLKNIEEFECELSKLSKECKDMLPVSLRNKVCAHIDQGFTHIDFTNAYIYPSAIEIYINLIIKLKKLFFNFCGHAEYDHPFDKILEQSEFITKIIINNSSNDHKL